MAKVLGILERSVDAIKCSCASLAVGMIYGKPGTKLENCTSTVGKWETKIRRGKTSFHPFLKVNSSNNFQP